MRKTYQGPVNHKKIPDRKGIVVFYHPNEFNDVTDHLKHHRIEVQSMQRRATGDYGIKGKQSSATFVVITEMTATEMRNAIVNFLKEKMLPASNRFTDFKSTSKGRQFFNGLIAGRKNPNRYKTSKRILNQFREYASHNNVVIPPLEEGERKKNIKTYAYIKPAASFNFTGVAKVTSASKLIKKALYDMGYQSTYIELKKKNKK